MGRWAGLWTPVFVVMAAIWVLSSRSSLPGGGWIPDKVAHAVIYGALGWLALRATHGGLHPLRVGAVIAAVVLTVGYGAIDEWHQSWIPDRNPSPFDVLADAVGALLAVVSFRGSVGLAAQGRRRSAS